MNIKTIGHDSEYNLWLVAVLFFDAEADVDILSEATTSGDTLTVNTTINFNQNQYFGEYSFTEPQLTDEHTFRRIAAAVSGMSLRIAAAQVFDKRLPWGVMTGVRPAKPFRKMLTDGLSDDECIAYMTKLYGASEEKLNLALRVAHNELPIIQNNKSTDIGLYIGIPFCPTRCLYCSFVSADLRHTKKYVDDYVRLLADEIRYSTSQIKEHGLNVQSVYFGGGTPTSLSADALEFLLTTVKENVDLSNTIEFCVEAGRPDTITKEKLEVLKKHGVTRISINPQTMNNKTLEAIGRAHTAEEIISTFKLARHAGFDNINTDLIVGLPMEDENDFSHTLAQITDLAPENITVHTMSVKRGSALHQKLGDYSLTNPETVQNMLSIAQNFMQNAQYNPYYMYRQKNMLGNFENVGYTKPGYASVYNVNIMEEVQSILALGASGSSKHVDSKTDRIERVYNFKSPIEYINRFDEILKKKDDFFKLVQS